MISSIETILRLHGLPVSLPRENTVEIEMEEGILIFRASKIAQPRIEQLLDKHREEKLTDLEETELDQYDEIDDYSSFLNRPTCNLTTIWNST